MRIIFMGNPAFAIPSLQILNDSNHVIAAVLSNTPKPMGRKRKYLETAVSQAALDMKLNLIHGSDLNDPNLIRVLKNLEPDLFAVAAYRILPDSMLSIPVFGSINLHGSLLPFYRGAAPIQRVLMNGDYTTGLTTFLIEPAVDKGKILLQKTMIIDPDDDYGSLYKKMSLTGAELLLNTINQYESGSITPRIQKSEQATLAPKITKNDCRINWHSSAESIKNLIRALAPDPAAFTLLNNKRIKIFKAEVVNKNQNIAPGSIIKKTAGELIIQTGSDCITITDLQIEGKRRMGIEEFLKGSKISAGNSFN